MDNVTGNIIPSGAAVRRGLIGAPFLVGEGGAGTYQYAPVQYIDSGTKESRTTVNAFAKQRNAQAVPGTALSASGPADTDYKKTYDALVSWILYYRPSLAAPNVRGAGAEKVLKTRINANVRSSLVLTILAIVNANETNIDASMQRYAAVIEALEKSTNLKSAALNATFDINTAGLFNPNTFISEMMQFLRTSNVTSKNVHLNAVESALRDIVITANDKAIVEYLSQLQDRFPADVANDNSRRVYQNIEADAGRYARAPVVMATETLLTFSNFINDRLGVVDVVGVPASPVSAEVFMPYDQFLAVADAQKRRGDIKAKAESLGPAFVRSDDMGNDLAHTALVRKITSIKRTGAFEQDLREQAETRAAINRRRQTTTAGQQIFPGSRGLPVSTKSVNTLTPIIRDLNDQRYDDFAIYKDKQEKRREAHDRRGRSRGASSSSSSSSLRSAAEIFGGRGSRIPPPSNPHPEKEQTHRDRMREMVFIEQDLSMNMAILFADITRNSAGLLRAIALVFLTTPVNDMSMRANIINGLAHPFNYLLVRPHARYRTLAAIKCVPGFDTGRTWMGHIKTEVGDDAATGVHHVNVTYYAKSEVTNPKNVVNLNNVMVVDSEGGLSRGFYQKSNYDPTNNNYGDDLDSFFVFLIPRSEKPAANPLSLTGKYHWVSGVPNMQPIKEVEKGFMTYTTAPWYNAYWGFHNQRFNLELQDSMYTNYSSEVSIPNEMAFLSFAHYWTGKRFGQATAQTGHWRNKSVGFGMRRARISKEPFPINDNHSVYSDVNTTIINVY